VNHETFNDEALNHCAMNLVLLMAEAVISWEKHGDQNGGRYPLVNIYITMEKITISNGKTHYFYGHFQ